MIKTIGLTGSIATGKSTASKYLLKLGCNVIDGDLIAREVAEDPKVIEQIENTFGEEFLDKKGELRRKKLGALVFSDKEALNKLNEIMHPVIRKKIQHRLEDLKDHYQKSLRKDLENPKALTDLTESRGFPKYPLYCIILDGALLIEMGLHFMVDEVWVVSISKEEQIRRLMERDKISKTDAEKRIESQMSTDEKKRFADVVLNNDKNPEYLQEQIEREIKRLKNNGNRKNRCN